MDNYEYTTNQSQNTTAQGQQSLHEASKAIKREARRSLKGNLSWSVGAVFVFCILETLLILVDYGAQEVSYSLLWDTPMQYIPDYVIEFLGDLVLGLLCYGLSSIFLLLQYGQPTGFSDLFRGFRENTGTIMLVQLAYVLMTKVAHLPLYMVSEYYHIGLDSAFSAQAVVAMLLYFVAFLIYIAADLWIFYTYALIWYVLLDYPDLSWHEVLRTSRRLMKGNRLALLYVQLSFIPWYLLCIFTFGIAAFWVRAYVEATNAAFYRGLILSRQNKTSR